MRISLLVLIFCSFLSLNAQQQKPDRSEPQPEARQQEHKTTPDDLQALSEDVTRMKALVQQMETNLAFVDTTQSPLKHQFQIEIEAWQVLIAQMERRLAAAGH
jgi:uncharacterized protein YlxW (UPF0749 family)